MEKNDRWRGLVKKAAMITLGNLMYALAVNMFIVPNDLITGGTTGLAVIHGGKVVRTEDEPTGGTHLSLVLAGNYHISFEEAEAIKQDYSRHKEILPVVKAVVEKIASIIKRYVDPKDVDTIYLCGGTCCLTGIENIIQKETGIKTVKPADPFLVTPAGIAVNCLTPD